MYIIFNANPSNNRTTDCVIRAISFVCDQDWETTFMHLAVECIIYHDMPEANYIWAGYLKSRGFKQHLLPDTCPVCYTVRDFCRDYPVGTYLLAIGDHVVAVKDGDYYDIWDSGDEVPVYYWRKEQN